MAVQNRKAFKNRGNGYSLEMNGKQLALTITAVVSMVVAAFGLGVVVGRNLDPTEAGQVEAAKLTTSNSTEVTATTAVTTETTAPTEAAPVATAPNGGPMITFYDSEGKGTPAPAAVVPVSAAQPAAVPSPVAQPAVMAEAAKPSATTKADTAKVAPAPKPTATASVKPASSSDKGRYTIQLSAFRDEPPAKQLKDEVKKKGYEAYIQTVSLEGKGKWYRVRVGHFKTKDSANLVADRLRLRDGLKGYITVTDE